MNETNSVLEIRRRSLNSDALHAESPDHLVHERFFNELFENYKTMSMYMLLVPSLYTKFIKKSHQNLQVYPIFRDKA